MQQVNSYCVCKENNNFYKLRQNDKCLQKFLATGVHNVKSDVFLLTIFFALLPIFFRQVEFHLEKKLLILPLQMIDWF